MGRLREFFRHAFAVEDPADFRPTDEERRVVDALAEKIVRHGMTVPALLFLESVRPMNFVAGQTMAFFEPVVRGLFDFRGYAVFQRLLHHRGSIGLVMERIEHFEAVAGRAKCAGERAEGE